MKNTTLLLFSLVVISAMLIAGCTMPGTQPQKTTVVVVKPTATPTATTTTGLTGCEMIATDKANMTMMQNRNLRNVAWCEVILWCGDGGTFSTLSMNDPKDSCPEAAFMGLDKTALAKQYQVSTVSTNPDLGRKFWTLDTFDVEESPTVRDFNGIKARYAGDTAAGSDGKPLDLSAAGIPAYQYKELAFYRTSNIVFEKGKPVFMIVDINGTKWVNKAYQTGVDPTLTYAGMATLGTRLKYLPAGWKFETKILTEDLVIKANGLQPIMWDELGGAYDKLIPGVANYIP